MFQPAGLPTLEYAVRVLMALAHIVGLVIAIMLLVRKRGTPAFLALVAFALLVLLDVGGIIQIAFLRQAVARLIRSPRGLSWALGGLNCCCGLLDLIAVGCLIAALWLGLGPKAAEGLSEGAAEESQT